MLFTPNIIVHTQPAIAINADDGTNPNALTYNEIKQSMGSIVYDVTQLYIYSDNGSQLSGAISYRRFDSNGNIVVKPIVTTVNPNQPANAIYVDLKEKDTQFLLNGNANFNATILPNTSVLIKFFVNETTTLKNDNFKGFESFFEIADEQNAHPTENDIAVPAKFVNFSGEGKKGQTYTLLGTFFWAFSGYLIYKLFKK